MENEFNYQTVPFGFAHCFNSQCPKAEECLRHLAAKHCTSEYLTVNIINPICIPSDVNTCSHILPTAKIHAAWGIKNLLDNVPFKIAHELKEQMMRHFGRNRYYRFYRKETYLTPEDQAYVCQLFQKKGIEESPTFDSYSKEYRW